MSTADFDLYVSKSLNPFMGKKKEAEAKRCRDDILVSAKTFITENKGKFRDNYKVGHIIGTGSYGQVRKCLHIKTSNVRAVKLISKSILSDNVKTGIMKELEILRCLVFMLNRTTQTL